MHFLWSNNDVIQLLKLGQFYTPKILYFHSQKLAALLRPVENHSGARENIPAGPLWEENFDYFFKWRILVYFIFLSVFDPNVAGPMATDPLPHPLHGPDAPDKINSRVC